MLCLLFAELLDRRQFGALEEAALDDVGVEGGLEVLERQRVVEDADVALAELLGFACRRRCWRRSWWCVPLSLPQAARKAAGAAEPPVSAMNLRRETGSLASAGDALLAAPSTSRVRLLSGMSAPRWFALLRTPTRPAGGRIIGHRESDGTVIRPRASGVCGMGTGIHPSLQRPRRRLVCPSSSPTRGLWLRRLRRRRRRRPTPRPPTRARAPSAGAAQAVKIVDYTYAPAELDRRRPAPTVELHQRRLDPPHGDLERVGRLRKRHDRAPARAAKVTLEKPGTYAYYCAFHPFMKGTITVE